MSKSTPEAEASHIDIVDGPPDAAAGKDPSAPDAVLKAGPPINSLWISKVTLRRFKQFKDAEILLKPGVSLAAGANNSGKSSMLHALAVWEFCRTATLMERGPAGILPDATQRQGFGLGDDEFSPINVPSLKHLWSNLKTAKTPQDSDGYTLSITCAWQSPSGERHLGFSLALANDRLFIKVSESNLSGSDMTPVCGYLPPFAGIAAREERVGGAIRRRRIGEGLAGAVLRNLLLDMHQANTLRRSELKAGRRKILDADLKRLREEDPWELLQQTLRTIFKAEIQMDDFAEDYHSYIKAEVVKGDVDGYKLTRYPNYTARDLMVEGSGLMQWLSVYALAVTPDVNVLMFDEPDAHLHPSLQMQLVSSLTKLAEKTDKQLLIATHSAEILKRASPSYILHIKPGGAKYLNEEYQKVGLLEGLGSDYAPRFDRVRTAKRVLFVEGTSDLAILKLLAVKLGEEWNDSWVEWVTTASQKERRLLWQAMCDEFGAVKAISLRDRDDEAIGSVGACLEDKSFSKFEDSGFLARKWRRRYIESYLIWPEAISATTGLPLEEVESRLTDKFALSLGPTFTDKCAPGTLLDLRGKEVLAEFGVSAIDVAKEMPVQAICEDVREFIGLLSGSAY